MHTKGAGAGFLVIKKIKKLNLITQVGKKYIENDKILSHIVVVLSR